MSVLLAGLILSSRLNSQVPPAQEVLSKVNLTYANLESYMDWGQITFSYRSAAGEHRGETRFFNTAFKRPNRLRYELVEPATEVAKEKRWVTWSAYRSGYATWVSWLPRETDRISLQKSLVRSWGMSESSGLILKMLAPWAISSPRATGLRDAAIFRDEIDGHVCWRIDGSCEDGAQASLWVDQRTSLFVRYRHTVDAKLDGKPTNEIYTVDFKSTGNPAMSASELRFSPPEYGSHTRHRKKHRKRHKG